MEEPLPVAPTIQASGPLRFVTSTTDPSPPASGAYTATFSSSQGWRSVNDSPLPFQRINAMIAKTESTPSASDSLPDSSVSDVSMQFQPVEVHPTTLFKHQSLQQQYHDQLDGKEFSTPTSYPKHIDSKLELPMFHFLAPSGRKIVFYVNVRLRQWFCGAENCTKVYDRVNSLEYHLLAGHLNERPYPCSTCSQGFFQECDRKRHEQRHIAESGKGKMLPTLPAGDRRRTEEIVTRRKPQRRSFSDEDDDSDEMPPPASPHHLRPKTLLAMNPPSISPKRQNSVPKPSDETIKPISSFSPFNALVSLAHEERVNRNKEP